MRFQFNPSAMVGLEANSATHEVVNGTTVDYTALAFDDTTEEFANAKLELPATITGTVTFRATVMAKTADASKNVSLNFGHVARANSEDFDVAYSTKNSGDKAIDATQDDLTVIEWTETVGNLGWTAEDIVFWRFSRQAAGTNNLVGDMYLVYLTIDVPES